MKKYVYGLNEEELIEKIKEALFEMQENCEVKMKIFKTFLGEYNVYIED